MGAGGHPWNRFLLISDSMTKLGMKLMLHVIVMNIP
jgi:hypothetical protein